MTKVIDYYLFLISPWAYLGGPRFADIARRHGAEVRVKPIDARIVFPATGGVPLAKRAPERQAYRLAELARWSRHLDMPLNLQPAHFPAPDENAARLVIAAGATDGDAFGLSQAILAALWTEERDITDPTVLEQIAGACGLDGAALLAKAQEEAGGASYRDISEEAVARGVFGAPSYVYQDEVFWGQDRLDFLDRALAAN
jgi:2-hydroxychromene-2-carboxylate isomerase